MQTTHQICIECATSGISQQVANERCACCGTVAPATIEPRAFWETKDQFIARAMESQRAFEAALVETAPVEVEAPVPCCHVKVIRRFYAIAMESGLDVKAVDRMRGAFSMALGRRVESRKQLTADNWAMLGDLAKSGVLIW